MLQIRTHLDTETWLAFENLVDCNTSVRSVPCVSIPDHLEPMLRTGYDIAQYADEQPREWEAIIQEAEIDDAHVILVGNFELDVDVGRRRVRVEGVTPWMELMPGENEPEPTEWTGLLTLWMHDRHVLLLTLASEPCL